MVNLPRTEKGTLQTYAWPGGYPIFYLDQRCDALCPTCAIEIDTDPDSDAHLIAAEVNWESTDLVCDECGKLIESAYCES